MKRSSHTHTLSSSQWGIFSAIAGGMGYAFSPLYRGLTFQFKVYVHPSIHPSIIALPVLYLSVLENKEFSSTRPTTLTFPSPCQPNFLTRHAVSSKCLA